MSEDKRKAMGNIFMAIGALMLVGAFFDQLKELHSWADLFNPHTLGEFGSRYIGAAVGIVGAYFGGQAERSHGLFIGVGRK